MNEVLENSKKDPNLIVDGTISLSDASDESISLVSKHICFLLSLVLPNMVEVQSDDSKPFSLNEIPFSVVGKEFEEKIEHFFVFIRYYTHLTVAELLATDALIYRLVKAELENLRTNNRTIISEANLGTLLVCGTLLALKMNRDHPVRNSWWSKMFNISLDVLNESENVFLNKIGFSCYLSESCYSCLFRYFIIPTLKSIPLSQENENLVSRFNKLNTD